MASSIEQHDSENLRCLQLGGVVTFNYCRQEGRGLPCKLIVGCWHGRVDIVTFLREHYTADELQQALQPEPGSKLAQFIELVRRAKGGPQAPTQADEPCE